MSEQPSTFADVKTSEAQAILKARGDDPDASGQEFFGLAFSGGGIRSATFNLGIIQALVERGLIQRVDYLSVVSGGSYIGSWLSALQQRDGDAALAELAPALPAAPQAAPKESAAVRFLRRYSNYLTPRYGLLSLDTLAAVANLNRNLILNQLIFFAFLVALLLLPRIAAGALGQLVAASPATPLLASGLLLAFAAWGIGRGLAGLPAETAPADGVSAWKQRRVALRIVAPGALACLLLAAWFGCPGTTPGMACTAWAMPVDTAMVGGVVVYGGLFLIWAAAWSTRRGLPAAGGIWAVIFHLAAACLAGAAGGFLVWTYGRFAAEYGVGHPYWFGAGPGACLLLIIVSAVLTLHLGLAKRRFSEEAREWFGRVGGLALGLGIAWLVLVAIVAVVPAALDYGGSWLIYGGGLAWLASSIGGVVLGGSPLTQASAGKGGKPWAERGARIAPYVFVVGLLGALSWATAWGLGKATDSDSSAETASTQVMRWRVEQENQAGLAYRFEGEAHSAAGAPSLSSRIDERLKQAETVWAEHPASVLLALFGALALAGGLAFRVDVNLFSMHQFYRNRLARAYLGASRGAARKADPFTDFDPADDLPLAQLRGQRPYLLVNAALNITDGKHLEWQERQSAAFVFAPGYCGYTFPGGAIDAYRPTDRYLSRERLGGDGNGGVRLGAAMAVSGAAANPNSGYHSSPAVSFLLALFNVRLGRWCGNPRNDRTWTNSSPGWGLYYLLKELFGATDENDGYLNLSDGGHFENLGLYELVRRRCRLIVVCDAGQDKDFQFEDLGNAVRKCRVDHGVEISIDPRPMAGADPANRPRSVVGRIDYGDGQPGVLLYLKPLLRQDESVDVLHYAATHPDFPHQSTNDQWFDESQFESYRQLGLRTGLDVFGRPAWHAANPMDSAAGGSAWIRSVLASLAPLASLSAAQAAQRRVP